MMIIINIYLKESKRFRQRSKSEPKGQPLPKEIYEKLLDSIPNLKFVVIGKSKQDGIGKLFGKKDEDYEFECYKKIKQSIKNMPQEEIKAKEKEIVKQLIEAGKEMIKVIKEIKSEE